MAQAPVIALISNFGSEDSYAGALWGALFSRYEILLEDGTVLPLSDHYPDVKTPGTLMALVVGNGLLEISARPSRASDMFAGALGTRFRLIPER